MSYTPVIGNAVSAVNSTTTLLGAAETFTGEWEDITQFTTIGTAILTDNVTDGTLYMDVSMDGGNEYISIPFDVANSTFNLPRIINRVESYVRIRYTNGTTPQTGFFNLQTSYSNGGTLDLAFPVNGSITAENNVTLTKSVIAGETLDGDLEPTGVYNNVSLTENNALKTSIPPTTLYQKTRPTDPLIPSGSAITVDPVLNTEPNVLDSGWLPVNSYGGGSLININTDTGLDAYVMNASDDQGNNIQGNLAPSLCVVGGLSATIGAAFFDNYFRVVVVNTSGSDATEYSIRASANQVAATPVFTSLNQQIQTFFPAPVTRVGNDVTTDRNFERIGGESNKRKFGYNESVSNSSFETIWAGAYLGGVANYVFPQAAETIRVKSGGNANDDAAGTGARTVIVEGLDENWLEVTETLTLAGAAASAPSTTTFTRINRVSTGEVGTYGGTNTGDIVIENTSTLIELAYIPAELGNTQQCVYTVPANKTCYITKIKVSVGESNSADIRLFHIENVDDIVAPFGPKHFEWGIEDYSGSDNFELSTYLKIEEKNDIIADALRVTGSGTARVSLDFEFILINN